MSGVVLLVIVLAVVFPIVLYLLIKSETASPLVVDRQTAEKEAQSFGGRRGRSVTTQQGDERDDSDSDEETKSHWENSRFQNE